MNQLIKMFTRGHVALYRLTKGRAMGIFRGVPILLLTTVGRKSGQRRTTPLMYIRDGDAYVIVASNNGGDNHPGWFYNIQASPQVDVEIPGQRLEVTASVASQPERDRIWPRLVSEAPFMDDYQNGTTREIPLVVLAPRGRTLATPTAG